ERFGCRLVDLAGHRHLDGDDEITGALLGGHATTLGPQPRTGLGTGGHLELDLRAVQCRHADRGALHRLGEGDRHGDGQVLAAETERRVRVDLHRDHQVTGTSAGGTGLALATQPDLLPVVHTRGDAHLHAAGAVQREVHRGTLDRRTERQRGGGGDVATLDRAALEPGTPAGGSPAEHAAEDVLEAPAAGHAATGHSGGGVAHARSATPATEHAAEEVLEAAGSGGPAGAGGEPRSASGHSAQRVVLLALFG